MRDVTHPGYPGLEILNCWKGRYLFRDGPGINDPLVAVEVPEDAPREQAFAEARRRLDEEA